MKTGIALLRDHMKESGITALKISKEVGYSPQYVCDILNGRRQPSITTARTILKIAKADRLIAQMCAIAWGSTQMREGRMWGAMMTGQDSDGQGACDRITMFLETLNRSQFEGEPINWADLSCTDVRVVTEVSAGFDKDCVIVEIEEAAPNDCPELCSAVEDFCVKDFGWPRVEVTTEW